MSESISREEVLETLKKVRHPEIARTLVELGMIRDVEVDGGTVTVTMALPFPTVPTQDYLAQIVIDAVSESSDELKVKVEFVEMTPEEKANFFKMAREGWIGPI